MGCSKGEQCSARVSYDSWGHTLQCERKAVVERDGKFYCKIHDPEYIKQKDADRTTKYNKEWEEKDARFKLVSTAVNACKAINPDNPLAVAESIGEMYEALIKVEKDAVPEKMISFSTLETVTKVLAKARSKA